MRRVYGGRLAAPSLVLVALAGCVAPAQPPLGAGDARVVHDSAQTVYATMYGSANEQAALQYLTGQDLNGPTQNCMAKAGYDWRPLLAVTAHPVAADALGDTLWLRDPGRAITSENLRLQALYQRREKAVERSELDPVTHRALLACLDAPGRPSDQELDSRGYSGVDGGRALVAWTTLVEKLDASLGDPAAYDRCLAESGEALGTDGPFSPRTQQARLATLAPDPEQVPIGDEAPSAEWVEFRAAEERWLAADAVCRETQYLAGMAAMEGELAAFTERYAETLANYEEHWAAVVSEARERGWEPNGWLAADE